MSLEEIRALEDRILADSQKLAELHRAQPPQAVEDYALKRSTGEVKLSELFAGKADLIVIHNMGTGCSYCTMWADGINGLWEHLADRAGLVLVSPDPPEVLEKFAAGRGWGFPLASADGSTFNADLGMENDAGRAEPGMSSFHRGADGAIERIANEGFGPFDLFCPTWHLMARLKEGVADWEPKYSYPEREND